MRISDIIKAPEYFPEAVFVEIKNILGTTFELKDFKAYTNDKGDGAVLLLESADGDLLKVYTHAKAIVRILSDDGFIQVWDDPKRPPIEIAFVEKISKTGAKYFMIE